MTLRDKQRAFGRMARIERNIKGARFKSAEEYGALIAKLRVLQALVRE